MKILVTIKPDGDTKIEVEDAVGDECLKATKSIEEALGKVSKREHKDTGTKSEIGEKVKVG